MSEENQNVVKKNVLKSYLAMARDCVGAKVWQHFYAEVDGEEIDVMYGGSNACAWFVSGVLVMQKLIKSSHATVASTVKDMEETGFITLTSPKPGSVILYAPKVFEDGSTHEHLAIYLGDDMAISTSFTKAVPILHDWRYRDHTERKITAIYYPTVWPK
jgi:hypothetical protein